MYQNKIRILHVIYCMNPGGIENWLMNLLRFINKDNFKMDFLVHTQKIGVYDNEIIKLGANIYRCPYSDKPIKYSLNLKFLIKKHGPYNVIHSHVHHYSGWVLRSAYQVGIPIRIAHSHSNINELISQSGWVRKGYYLYMKYLVRRYASIGIAVSKQSARSLFGSKWEADPKWQIIHCGIDVDQFKKSVDQSVVRRKLGIPSDCLVVGHIGRFSEAKNHFFIIDVFLEIIKIDSSVRLLLVGDGEELINVKKLALKNGLHKKIIFTGLRSDIAELMLGAMDIFLFPSLWEGLPMAIVEAQTSGLPCVFSEHIPPEAEILPQLLYRMQLSKGAKEWAEKIIDIYNMKQRGKISQRETVPRVINSPFNFNAGREKLESIYNRNNPF